MPCFLWGLDRCSATACAQQQTNMWPGAVRVLQPCTHEGAHVAGWIGQVACGPGLFCSSAALYNRLHMVVGVATATAGNAGHQQSAEGNCRLLPQPVPRPPKCPQHAALSSCTERKGARRDLPPPPLPRTQGDSACQQRAAAACPTDGGLSVTLGLRGLRPVGIPAPWACAVLRVGTE